MRSELLESELELYVQRLLVHESYNTGHSYRMLKISPSEERLKGYDANILGLTPFYCQFKTSDFLRQGKLYERRAAFFKSRRWPISPFYSFALRVPNDPRDRTKPQVWQHNVLHALWNGNPSGVAYVAPLFHTRTELELLEPAPYRGCCIFCDGRMHGSSVSIRQVAVNAHDRCRLPSFDGLISIPPHLPVKDLKHSYAFNSHRDITFHSEPELVEGGRPFGEALEQFVRSSSERDVPLAADAVGLDVIASVLGGLGQDQEFLRSFLAFGLYQAGFGDPEQLREPRRIWQDVGEIQRHIAFSASLQAYFGISTLGLIRVDDK